MQKCPLELSPSLLLSQFPVRFLLNGAQLHDCKDKSRFVWISNFRARIWLFYFNYWELSRCPSNASKQWTGPPSCLCGQRSVCASSVRCSANFQFESFYGSPCSFIQASFQSKLRTNLNLRSEGTRSMLTFDSNVKVYKHVAVHTKPFSLLSIDASRKARRKLLKNI